MSPIGLANRLGILHSQCFDAANRKDLAQFFTPPETARFMASIATPLHTGARVVEPAGGCGILIAALAERFCDPAVCLEWNATVYEIDPQLRPSLYLVLAYTQQWLAIRGVHFSFCILCEDFLLSNAPHLRTIPMLLDAVTELQPIHLVISNPPYFKLRKSDPRVEIIPEITYGQPNIYTLFMAATVKMLHPQGELLFITPRSFCAGPYFQQFRKWFFKQIAIKRIHLFSSRTEAFNHDDVLQENIILVGQKETIQPDHVEISVSKGVVDLAVTEAREIPINEVIDAYSHEAILSIPVHETDSEIRSIFKRWTCRLRNMGLEISTGPIVPFRTDSLATVGAGEETAPLLWVQHIGRMDIKWPLFQFHKPQWIRINSGTRGITVANSNYVLLRRFSPKEENSRITAAPYLQGSFPSQRLGIENHINYIHRPGGTMSPAETYGLAAFLNSQWVDQYFRLSSGNTQISATELRNLPMPTIEEIVRIGEGIGMYEHDSASQVGRINEIVSEVLDLPMNLSGTNGDHMPKIEEAKALLKALGLPSAQSNETAALTLLALANLSEKDTWKKAQIREIRIHDMMTFIEQHYHKRYAENSRETFRRQVLHQFEQARIVDRNPSEPTLPTNHPRTSYALSVAVMPVIQSYGSRTGKAKLDEFLSQFSSLEATYQKKRVQNLIPIHDAKGNEYQLTPGKHNRLQALVLEQFAPRFATGTRLLYLGDTANKSLIIETDGLAQIGFPAGKHDKLPDIILYHSRKKWLYLIEVETSHGPVSPKRFVELETILASCSAGRIYVSAFPDFKEYLRHARNVAWETEIWVGEAPDHLIHYNGDKFMGPRNM